MSFSSFLKWILVLFVSVLAAPSFGAEPLHDGSLQASRISGPPTFMPLEWAQERTLEAQLRGSIRSVLPTGNRKVAALTFDLCETAGEVYGYDAAVVDYLKAARVKATFFAGGKYMKTHPAQSMALMSEPLFEIGNHSWSHKNFRKIPPDEMEDQVLRTQRQYELLRQELVTATPPGPKRGIDPTSIPAAPRLFRFPYGTCTPEALNLLAHLGLASIQWSIVSGDASPSQTSSGIIRTVLGSMKPGAIVVFHANGRGHGTSGALPVLVPKLRSAGYDFLTVSELLDAGTPLVVSECYEEKPGDNFRYDKKPRGNKGGNR